MLQELKVALRGLARSPGFSIIAIVTLALGIGANTAVFTLVDAILLRPLPYESPDRLVSVSHLGRGGEDELLVSPGFHVLYNQEARSLESFALHTATAVNLSGTEGQAQRLEGQSVTPSLFDVLRVEAELGRRLYESDGEPDADPVVVIGHGFWRSQFGGTPGAVGETLVMDGVSRTIIGVMPEDFTHPDGDTQFWIPLTFNPTAPPLMPFGWNGIGRLAEGATVDGLRGELSGIINRLAELRPDAAPAVGFLREAKLAAVVDPLKAATVGNVERTLWTLLGMVGFVLLIACANVANLLLVRADGRQRELALRRAVGAGQWQVLRPFLAESLWLAVIGGLLGIAVAAVAVDATLQVAPENLPRRSEIGVDLRVLGFTGGVALLAALLFGLFPALRYGRSDLSGALQEGGGRGGTADRSRHLVRNGLVVTQVALALMLLIGSGLMVRSLLTLLAVDPGFEPEGVLVAELTVPAGEIASPVQTAEFFQQLRERLAQEPRVREVGIINSIPFGGQIGLGGHQIEDHPTPPDALPPMAFSLSAGEGYFAAMGIPIIAGRALDSRDGAAGFRGVVVSQAYAARWWPGESALGRRVQWGPGEWWEIVGVVGDVKNRGLQQPAEEIVYMPPLVGTPEQPLIMRSRDLVVRVAGEPSSFVPALRQSVADLNPNIPLSNPRTMVSVVQESASQMSFTMRILAGASLLALVLGMVGIYGVVSYVVTQRTREIGIRMAIGASAGDVRRMVVLQGVGLALAGVVLGLVASLAASRLLSTLLYGVEPTDPMTYATVAALLAFVAVAASWIPAARAAATQPVVALRTD